MQRREFMQQSSAGAASITVAALTATGYLAATSTQRAASKNLVNGKIVVCCGGIKGRGRQLFSEFGKCEDVEVKYACDIDGDVLDQRTGDFTSQFGRTPEKIKDYRRALDDKHCDALVMGTPDHWHAIPAVHACQAGKDVYSEKPDGQNLIEGQVMAAAAKKYGRIIQLGTQARSDPKLLELVEYVKKGALGRPLMAKAWESTRQKNLGKPADGAAPSTIDYDVWLGPAPKREFNPLRFHSNWRWFFDYGGGDLANDGIHRLDQARWFLDVAMQAVGEKPLGMPKKVSSLGGKYYFDDAQEWPDTMMTTYDYGNGKLLTYEMRIWAPYPLHEEGEGAAVLGDQGSLVIGGSRWRHFGPKGELIVETARTKAGADEAHVRDFLDCMRSREQPRASQETVGRESSLLSHLGNASWRSGKTLEFDYNKYRFTDESANHLLTRAEYRKPYVLPKPSEV